MFVTTVASLASLATVQQPLVPSMDSTARMRREMTSSLHDTLMASIGTVREPRGQTRGTDDHMDSARRALKAGEFDIARREFRAAAALTRAAGKLPLEAVLGLVEALYAQSYNREAASALEVLAAEASLLGDNNVEAIALADALWLNTEAGQRDTARKQRNRLRSLMKDAVLTPDVQRAVRARVG